MLNRFMPQCLSSLSVRLITYVGLGLFVSPLFAEESTETSLPAMDATAALEQIRQLDSELEAIIKQEQLLRAELLSRRRIATDGERKWQSILGELEQNSLQQRDLEQSLKKARKERDEALAKQKESITAVETARKELEKAQQRLKEAEANAEKAKGALQAAEKPIGDWEAKLTMLAGQVEPLQMTAAKAKEEATPAMEEVEAMQTRVAQVELQRLERREQIESLLKQSRQWISFTDQIAPIFQTRCVACHNARNAKGRYNMASYSALLSPGESGQAIIPGKADESLLVRLIEDGSMPVDADPLSPEQIAIIRKWIDLGARLDSIASADTRLVRLMPRVPQPTPPENYAAAMPVTALAVAPNNQLLVSSGYHELLIWSLPDAKLMRRIPDVAERVYGVDFHPDGKRIAVASGTPGQVGEVKVFDVESSETVNDFLVSEDSVFDVAFSPDGNRLAACSADGTIGIFELDDPKRSPILIEDHSDWVNSIAWSPDGKLLVSSSRDKTAKVFDSKTGKLYFTVTGHAQNMTTAIFNSDGSQLISGGDDRRLRIWKATEATEVKSFSVGSSELTDLTRLSDGRVLVAGSENLLRLYEFATGKELWKLKLPSSWVVSLAVSPDEQTAYCGTQDGQIHRIGLGGKPAVERSWKAKP